MTGIIEETIQELISLAKAKPLTGDRHRRVVELFTRLKEEGLTNSEISELTGGLWSPNTIKKYTRGAVTIAKAKSSTSHGKSSLSILPEILNSGLTMELVKRALALENELVSKGLRLNDIYFLFEESKKTGMPIRSIIDVHHTAELAGLSSVQALNDIIEFRRKSEESGVSIDDLERIETLCSVFGGKENVLEAIQRYGNIEAIRREQKQEKESLSSLDAENKRRQIQREEAEAASKQYEELKKMGFDAVALKSLANEARKSGGGVDRLLDRLAKQESIEKMNAKLKSLENEVHVKSAEVKSLDAKEKDLEAQVKRLEERVQRLYTEAEIVTNKISAKVISSLHAISSAHTSNIDNMGKTYQMKLAALQEVTMVKAENAIYEKESKVAGFLASSPQFSKADLRQLSLRDVVNLLAAARDILTAKELNPTIKVTEAGLDAKLSSELMYGDIILGCNSLIAGAIRAISLSQQTD